MARSRGIAIVPGEGPARQGGAGSLRRATCFHAEARRNAEAQRTLQDTAASITPECRQQGLLLGCEWRGASHRAAISTRKAVLRVSAPPREMLLPLPLLL